MPVKCNYLDTISRNSYGFIVLLFFVIGSVWNVKQCLAEELAGVAVGSSSVIVTGSGSATYLSLRIQSPDGTVAYDKSSTGTSLVWNVTEGSVAGLYLWEAQASNANQNSQRTSSEGVDAVELWRKSGSFTVKDMTILHLEEEEVGIFFPLQDIGSVLISAISDFFLPSAHADQQIQDDLIVTGSECVGLDCVNGEAFGFDTIRLKENNVRIKFIDTSNSSSFPTRDWQITINDSANGGANFFAIEDVDGARTPFRILSGAPTGSFYVHDNGSIGLGTTIPLVKLHLQDGDSPTVRLAQDSSKGWPEQTWDMVGNETSFYIRDTTHSSQKPFTIIPEAPTNSLYISDTGKIGFGTNVPSGQVHVAKVGPATGSLLKLDVTGSSETTDDLLVISAPAVPEGGGAAVPTTLFSVNGNGDAYIFGNLDVASSRKLKQDIKGINGEEAITALRQLEPVHFSYKKSPDVHSMGFIAEDVPGIVATKERKSIRPMDLVALLTKVTQEQQKTIETLATQIATLEKRLDAPKS